MSTPTNARMDLRVLISTSLLAATTGAVAQLALVLRLTYSTGSGWVVASLWLAGTVPTVLLAPVTGLLLDRSETVRVLRLLALVEAVLDLGLAAVPGVVPVLMLSLGLGVVSGTTVSGMYALAGALPWPEGEGQGQAEGRALTRIQAASWAGATIGPLGGAALVSVTGTRLPLVIDAIALILVAAGLGAVSTRRLPEPTSDRQRGALWSGLLVLVQDRQIRSLLAPIAVVIAAVNAAVVAEVFLATRVLRAGSLGYGGMVGIWGAGMVAGTLLAPKLGRLGPLTVTGIGGLLAAVGMAAAGAAPNLAVALLAYALGGVGNGMEVAAARILVQERAGRALHGRAFSAYFAFGSSAAIAGMALGGALLGWLGARGAMELSAGLAATAGLVLVTAGARLRPAASPQPGGS